MSGARVVWFVTELQVEAMRTLRAGGELEAARLDALLRKGLAYPRIKPAIGWELSPLGDALLKRLEAPAPAVAIDNV